ncbi:DoxX family membrane protein [Myroides guanonis]|uniref:Thiosulfate dehydrogenase [quinone] large subunit n=1 Tax=Myroides guanonis TaxID=1150112 RepID=A0A1I3PC02_9FLAO|nr:DoxX family membrane protein [Myroides guanonis]SFJ18992.1 thiosulfate dehydrogenase [quinone] large subunit [Myroides guanonis]
MLKFSNSQLGYLVVRIAMGLSLLMHGGVRIPKWGAFSSATADSFADTILPYELVYVFASVIIIGEVLSGVLLLLGGRFVRWGCALGILLMGFLMFGSGMLEQWQGVMNQIVHVLILYLLLINPNTQDPTMSRE